MKLKFHTSFEKYFAFFLAPASYALLGERQTYRAENALPKALLKKKKSAKKSREKTKY